MNTLIKILLSALFLLVIWADLNLSSSLPVQNSSPVEADGSLVVGTLVVCL